MTATVVGTVLAAINHGSAIATGEIEGSRLVRIGLTYCVPFIVSMSATVRTRLASDRERRGTDMTVHAPDRRGPGSFGGPVPATVDRAA